MAIISIDLGGTKVAGALIDSYGKIIDKKIMFLQGKTSDEVGNLINTIIESLMSYSRDKIKGIGVCVPGIVYSQSKTVWAPNIQGWDSYPLKAKIKEIINDTTINICIESDRTCYILGELWKGAAQGCTDAIYLAVGTGIGAGILIDGHIIHGASDIVGAIGWMALQSPYTERYKQVGCFEYYASGNGLGERAKDALRENKQYNGLLRKKEIEEISSHDLFNLYDSGDQIALQTINKAIEMWGMGCANLVSLFNPQKIIFGGGVFGPAIKFIPQIYSEALKWGQPISMKQVEFCKSEVAGEAALLGAAYLAIKNIE